MRKKIRGTVLISIILLGIMFALTSCVIEKENEVKKDQKIDNLEINYIEYSNGGGFGTEAECATKSIIIKDDGYVKLTNEYNKNIVEEFKIDEVVVRELVDYINENFEVFSKEDITDDDASDASSQYIIIKTKDGKNYKIGGYCVIDEQFNGIAKKIIDSIGKEEYKTYCNKVNSDR